MRAARSRSSLPSCSLEGFPRVRRRLLTYLSGQAVQAGGMEFDLPFNRQQLADYLTLDRSALSKELCRMRDEGLLTFRKIHFVLRQLPELL